MTDDPRWLCLVGDDAGRRYFTVTITVDGTLTIDRVAGERWARERAERALLDGVLDRRVAAPAAPAEAPTIISIEEAASMLGVHRATLGRMIRDGEGPPARRVGGGRRARYIIDRDAFLAWRKTSEPPLPQPRRGR
jgi:excisionase family DNA binding protein